MPWFASSRRGFKVRPSRMSSSTAVWLRCSFCTDCKIPSCICAFFAASNLLAITPPSGALAFDHAAPVTSNADSTPVPITKRERCGPASGASACLNALVAGKPGATNLRNAIVASSPATATQAATGNSATRGERKSKTNIRGVPNPDALLMMSSHSFQIGFLLLSASVSFGAAGVTDAAGTD